MSDSAHTSHPAVRKPVRRPLLIDYSILRLDPEVNREKRGVARGVALSVSRLDDLENSPCWNLVVHHRGSPLPRFFDHAFGGSGHFTIESFGGKMTVDYAPTRAGLVNALGIGFHL